MCVRVKVFEKRLLGGTLREFVFGLVGGVCIAIVGWGYMLQFHRPLVGLQDSEGSGVVAHHSPLFLLSRGLRFPGESF